MDINKLILIGNCGRDPEFRTFQNGDRVANVNLATTKSWKTKDGSKKEATEWHRLVITGPLVDVVERYVQKGTRLYVEGEIRTRKWTDQSGAERYSTEVQIPRFGGVLSIEARGRSSSEQKPSKPEGNSSGFPNDLDDDDDIPF